MCGRYVSATSADDIAAYFDVDMVAETLVEPNFNVAPTARVPVVREYEENRTLDLFSWGLVPFWAKDPKIGARMINARSETLREKNAFKRALVKRRCIVPADGFYEWTTVPPVATAPGTRGRKPKPKKQPWHIAPADGSMMAFAGLYEYWRGGEDENDPLLSCTIVTTTANDVIEPIHDRMPVVLPADAWDLWLDPTFDDLDALESMLVSAPSELFAIHAVSTDVNNARNSGAHLREPIDLRATDTIGAAESGAASDTQPQQGTLL